MAEQVTAMVGFLDAGAGQVCVADGSDIAGRKLERVLTNDPAMGVIRHTDAGYDRAAEVARERGVRVPMADQ